MKLLKRCRMKIRTKLIKCFNVATNLFRDYSQHSSIHGISYIGEQGRSWFEKLWWIAAISFSVLCCVKLIVDAANINPIIISFTEKPTPIWEIPFPAVSICPNVLTHYKHVNLTKVVYSQCKKSTDVRQKDLLNAVSMLCPAQVIYKKSKSYPNCNKCLATLREIGIPPDDFFVKCKFHNRTMNCLDSVKETVTSSALCYTFNGVDSYRNQANESVAPSDWSIDEGYKKPGTWDMYPRRGLGGRQFGFSVLLRLSKSDYEYTCSPYPGFHLEYRMPYDTPGLKTKSFEIPMGYSVNINLTPKVIKTMEELQRYSVAERKCYFSNEHRLKYFKQYTHSNCEIECEVDRILEKCKCLPIYIENRDNYEICGFRKLKCVERRISSLMKRNYASCNCVPACTTVTYVTELSLTPLNFFQYTELTIYFKENQFMTSERRELYGRTDFLANCGGLLGLFLGVSVLSILEVVYFCTIRLWSNLKYGLNISDPVENVLTNGNTFSKIMKQLIVDYTNKTTIQGINYATDTNLSRVERCWWTIVVVLSVLCCGSLIFDVVKHYDQSPIIVSYANEETPISQIPFPAVTICPQVVGFLIREWYDRFKFRNLSLYDHIPTIKDLVTALAQVCDPEIFGDIDPKNETNCDNCIGNLRYMMLKMDEMMSFCRYKTASKTCSKIFKDVITEAGNCYTFNGFHVYRHQNGIPLKDVKQWSLDDGYRNGTESLSVFPRPGSRSGLFMNLEARKDMNDGLCKGPIQGFKVYVHLPNESPQITKHFYLVPYQQFVQFLVDPKVIVSAPEIRDFPVSKRQCYFSNERYLRFFEYYTQNNCEVECVVNLTWSICKCLRFHVPRVTGVKICGISEINCYQQVIQQSIKENIGQSQNSGCNCLPTCNSISYDVEVSQLLLTNEALTYSTDYKKALIRRKCVARSKDDEYLLDDNYNYLDEYSVADFNIAFRENHFVAMQRSRLYGPTELLSNFGGLLGVFLGFSLMSILELIYFSTFRLFHSLKIQFMKRK